MGQRGPIASVRQLPGTTPKRPVPKRVTLAPGAPVPPPDLTVEAAAEWQRVVAELDGLGLLARIDRAVLTLHCSAWSMNREAEALLVKDGLTSTGRNQEAIKHPAWMIYTQSATLIAQLAKELFASPNARLRSQLPEGADDDQAEGGDILD